MSRKPLPALARVPAGHAEQLIVKNANLSMIVPNSTVAMQQVTDLAKLMKGYVVTSYLYKSTGEDGQTYTDANITIRVPVDRLEETLAKIRGLVKDPKVDITSENVTGEDVTAIVVDLESRLRNYEKVVVKLYELMDEAKKTEDALNVFNQIIYYQEQIEILKGQIKYYRETAAMSAITLSLTERQPVVPRSPSPAGSRAVWLSMPSGRWFTSCRVWQTCSSGSACASCPCLLLIWLPLWLIWRSMKRRGWVWKGWRPVKTSPAPEKPAEIPSIEKK